MIFRSFHGLRYRVLSPARYVFLLEENSPPLYLNFDGTYWHLRYKDEENETCFVSREAATFWLRNSVDKAETLHRVKFEYAHMEKDNG